jgi:hypothetical protein
MASSFTDENIDPSLLTMDPNMDPAQKLMARMRANPPSLTLNLPPPNDENIDNNDQLDLPSSIAIPNLSAPSNSSLVAFGRLVKRQVNLSDASSVAFDQFCQVYSYPLCKVNITIDVGSGSIVDPVGRRASGPCLCWCSSGAGFGEEE